MGQQPPSRAQARQNVMRAIELAAETGEYLFMLEVAQSQSMLRPHEIANGLDRQYRLTDDPMRAERYHAGLEWYLIGLSLQDHSEDETTRLVPVRERVSARASALGEITVETMTPLTGIALARAENQVPIAPDFGWEEDTYEVVAFDQVAHARLHATPLGRSISRTIEAAVAQTSFAGLGEVIERFQQADLSEESILRKILDLATFHVANRKGEAAVMLLDTSHFGMAHQGIDCYASDADQKLLMKRCLDKHVMAYAEIRLRTPAEENEKDPKQTTINVIKTYVSSKPRQLGMLSKLGLID